MEKKKLSIPQIIITSVFFLLGILCLLYGITIFLIHSGSKFYMVWFAGSFFFLLLSLMTVFRLFEKIPPAVRIIAVGILCVGLVYLLFTQIMIFSHFKDNTEKELDYLIVLGAQVKESGPSVILQYRLDRAVEYLNANPDTVCIVSGGKGVNEPVSEAEGMKKYLTEHGISADRILLEDKSTKTTENILYSKELIKDQNSSVGIVTNNFHLYRALRLAKKQISNPIYGISAYSNPVYLPNNMLRESIGVTKDVLKRNMNF